MALRHHPRRQLAKMTELKKAGAGFRVCFFKSVLKESSVLAGYFLVTVDSVGAEFFLYT